MTEDEIRRVELIPLDRVTVLNPRVRSRRNFEEIIDNIARVGLKRPITVSRRIGPDGEVGSISFAAKVGWKPLPS